MEQQILMVRNERGQFSKPQIVTQYAPNKPEHILEEKQEVEGVNETKVFTGTGALLYSTMFAYTHPQLIVMSLIVLSALLALYRHWYYNAPVEESEAVTEPLEQPEKPKRHYKHRMIVNHYELGRIRV